MTLLIVLLFSSFSSSRDVQANSSVNVDISFFHDALAPYGNWVNHPTYGQVWYPRDVVQDWRPYTDGYWAHTDEYGWLWVSNEPWGWAPFHYGRWAWDNWYGWIWVPGRIWAPAWVFWRSGGGYAAWAPIPPNVVWQPGIGLNISYFNYERDLSWDSWVAVHEHDLPHRHLNRHICPPRQNRQIIDVTKNTNNITIINNTIVNHGVPVKQIEEITRRPVERVVPEVHNRLDENRGRHPDGQPNIIRLPMAAPTAEEIHYNEELARRLDGKNPDGTRTILSQNHSRQPVNHEFRLPGRYAGTISERSSKDEKKDPIPLITDNLEEALHSPEVPETTATKHGHDSAVRHKKPGKGNNQDTMMPVQSADQQSVSTDDAPIPPMQNQRKPITIDKKSDKNPVVSQQQIPKYQEENLKRNKHLDPLQQELSPRRENPRKPEIEMQQQSELTGQEARMQQQEEVARQQEMQSRQQQELQQQQAEQVKQEEARRMQQQEVERQREMQSRQHQELQQQQAEQVKQEARQRQQQEVARQQEMQNRQQQELQQQQAEQARQEAQQLQQQEAARQQEIQNRQQQELQQRQVEQARQEEARQIQQQEVARQQEIKNRQQQELQQQQAEQARQEALRMQKQQAARQQKMQNQPLNEDQRQPALRSRREVQTMQKQQRSATVQ